MDSKPNNITLIFDADRMRAEKRHGVDLPERRSGPDYVVSGYQIGYALNGGYVVTVTYEGTEIKDFLTFTTKEDLLGALKHILK